MVLAVTRTWWRSSPPSNTTATYTIDLRPGLHECPAVCVTLTGWTLGCGVPIPREKRVRRGRTRRTSSRRGCRGRVSIAVEGGSAGPARRPYPVVSAPHAASAAHSRSAKAGWSSSTSNVTTNRYERVAGGCGPVRPRRDGRHPRSSVSAWRSQNQCPDYRGKLNAAAAWRRRTTCREERRGG